jgi:hypothetical protein
LAVFGRRSHLLQCDAQNPGYLHLRDPDDHSDLGLGQVLFEAQVDDFALASRQRRAQLGDRGALLDIVETGLEMAQRAVQPCGRLLSGRAMRLAALGGLGVLRGPLLRSARWPARCPARSA